MAESKTPRLSVTVTNPDGSIRYSTWNDAASGWKNVFCVFDEEYADRDGNPIGLSYWGVRSPIEQQREIEKLRRIVIEMVSHIDGDQAVADIRDALDDEHADLLADLLKMP